MTTYLIISRKPILFYFFFLNIKSFFFYYWCRIFQILALHFDRKSNHHDGKKYRRRSLRRFVSRVSDAVNSQTFYPQISDQEFDGYPNKSIMQSESKLTYVKNRLDEQRITDDEKNNRGLKTSQRVPNNISLKFYLTHYNSHNLQETTTNCIEKD